jgi:YHS domain-containing protein
MQRHDPSIEPLPETQEQGTQPSLTCHYCGKPLRYAAAVEAYDRTRKRRLLFCSEQCKQAARNRPDHYFRFSHKRRDTIRAHTAGAYEEAGDHRWENLARGLTGDGGA